MSGETAVTTTQYPIAKVVSRPDRIKKTCQVLAFDSSPTSSYTVADVAKPSGKQAARSAPSGRHRPAAPSVVSGAFFLLPTRQHLPPQHYGGGV